MKTFTAIDRSGMPVVLMLDKINALELTRGVNVNFVNIYMTAGTNLSLSFDSREAALDMMRDIVEAAE